MSFDEVIPIIRAVYLWPTWSPHIAVDKRNHLTVTKADFGFSGAEVAVFTDIARKFDLKWSIYCTPEGHCRAEFWEARP